MSVSLVLAAAACRSRTLAVRTSTDQSVTSPAVDNVEPRPAAAETAMYGNARKTADEKLTTADNGDGRFCNETTSYTVKTDCKPCVINAQLGCPDELLQLTQV